MEEIVSPGTTPEAISALEVAKSHTPGPWTLLRNNCVVQRAPGGRQRNLFEPCWNDAQGNADARLIATAPDLLDIAKLILRVDDEWKALSLDERTRVEAIVSKATGQ